MNRSVAFKAKEVDAKVLHANAEGRAIASSSTLQISAWAEESLETCGKVDRDW